VTIQDTITQLSQFQPSTPLDIQVMLPDGSTFIGVVDRIQASPIKNQQVTLCADHGSIEG
jgi:hypothetical protein